MRPNQVWAWDFVLDYTERGGALRAFNLIDEYIRQCHCFHADRAVMATDVVAVLEEAIERHGPPEYTRPDNGPEQERSGDRLPEAARRTSAASQFIANVIRDWLKKGGIKTIYIDPGCPWQNGYAERLPTAVFASLRFNSRFRAERLERELLHTLSESRIVYEDWLRYYNQERPHRSLGMRTSQQFAKERSWASAASVRPSGALLQQKHFTPQNHEPNPDRLS